MKQVTITRIEGGDEFLIYATKATDSFLVTCYKYDLQAEHRMSQQITLTKPKLMEVLAMVHSAEYVLERHGLEI